jgi:hypothetical protein
MFRLYGTEETKTVTGYAEPGLFDARAISSRTLKTQRRFYVGVDLGQAQNHSAIAVVERAEVLNPQRDPLTWSFRFDTRFHVRHAERIRQGAPYPEVVEHVKALSRRYPLEATNVTVIVDATGVGAPAVDLLRRGGLGCRVIPVVITAGGSESSDRARYRMSRADLMAGLQAALQKRRVAFAQGARTLPALVEELRSMQVGMSESGYERITGGRHDDLVLALSLAWWRASREAGVD